MSAILAACLGFFLNSAASAELKVDFNQSGRSLSETLDPAYAPWSTNSTWLSSVVNTISNTFNGVTIIFTRVGPEGTGLQSDWYKAGVDDAAHNSKLVNDGITVSPHNIGGNGGRIEMRIRGLTAGPHSLLSYHNTWQNPATYSFSPIKVSVNGVLVITNLPVSNRVTNNADAATAYVEFTAQAGQDVVILYQAETNNGATDKNVCIDGFEIDTPNVAYQASKPSPPDRDEHANADSHSFLLNWTAASNAVSHDVYFGTDSNGVLTATHAAPEFKGNQVATNFSVTNLSSFINYYWRVDEISAASLVTKGNLWYFRPRHLAFPGAEGYGRFARGGRGGIVVEVTNLNDSGPGSLRDAITGNYGPRTVVFTVSGLITLESDLIIGGSRPYITLAGQTAPGKGICTRKYQLGMSGGHDVIIRHIRSRPGNLAGITLNGSGMAGVDHTIMDHCSISWGIDEEMSTRGANNVTLQRTLISEALNIAGHDHYEPGYPHGFAATIGGDVGSFHHNLLAHCHGRNWSMGGGLDGGGSYAGRLDMRNNVVYNWRDRTTEGGAHEVNFVNNYYKPGAALNDTNYSAKVALDAQYNNFPGSQQYYFDGNVMPGYFDLSNQTNGRVATIDQPGGVIPTNYPIWVGAPFFESYVSTQTASNAYKTVLSDVGCTQPMIDDHDARVIRETIDGTYTYTGTGPYGGYPGLPNSQDDVGGWENYPQVTRPANFDTDHDGLPDWWERLKGLNTNSLAGDFSDSNVDLQGDEYTELERYLNWLAAPHVDCTGSVDIDLTQLTRGFTNNSPVYTVYDPTNGTVSLLSGKTAHFVPGAGSESLGSFTFNVIDAQGDSMTNVVGIHIQASAIVQPPLLGIRNTGGNLFLELTGEAGKTNTVQTSDNLSLWFDWTNALSTGSLQLLPLSGLTAQSPLFFRAVTQ